jgi:dTDP-4-dehydrorhamnose 3,5-epimerase
VIFTETPIGGAFVIELEAHRDVRGVFARTFDAEDFASRGLEARIAQTSISFNERRGTLRGMHYQAAPHEETKLVRCTRGAILDVIADVREGSPSRGTWFATELTFENRRMLYIPRGVAHGFQTLVDGAEVEYMISESHHPESARRFRWDDPAFAIAWPIADPIVSDADREAATSGQPPATARRKEQH